MLIRVPLAIFRMVTCQEKALENLKLGLFDVLPAGSLDSLTAEDFRLLLNGVSGHWLIEVIPQKVGFVNSISSLCELIVHGFGQVW